MLIRIISVIILSFLSLPLYGAEWQQSCTGEREQKVCILSRTQQYVNMRESVDTAILVIRKDQACTTLYINTQTRIALEQPVSFAIDDGEPVVFYKPEDLTRLARDIDESSRPDWGPPEFMAFYDEVAATPMTKGAVGNELVARFAHIKEPRRLALACSAAERLWPELIKGQTLTLSFHLENRMAPAIYHWPALKARTILISLDGLAEKLSTVRGN